MDPAPVKPFQFGLLAVFVVTTAVAVASAIARVSPGLAIMIVVTALLVLGLHWVDLLIKGSDQSEPPPTR